MVSVDAQFVLDCAGGDPSAIARLRQFQVRLEPLYLSEVARAAVVTKAADRDDTFRHRTERLIEATERLTIDPESVRCATEIAEELALTGRRLDGVDLFVAASARRYGQAVVSRNRAFASIRGVQCQMY